MTMTKRWMTGMMACGLLLTMAGCQTYGEAGGLGAVLGGTAGAIIGHQSGNALEGAAIGAALGGITGLIVHDIKAQKAKERQATVDYYNYQPSQGEVLSLEESYVGPNVTRAGAMIEATLQYAIIGTGGNTQVKETRRLLRGEKVVAELSSKTFNRSDGTWVTSQQFKLPSNLKPGQYSLIQKVETNKSTIFGTADFTVQ